MRAPLEAVGSDPTEGFRLEEFLPYRLSVAAYGVSRMIAHFHLQQSGIGIPEWWLLAAVSRHGVISPTMASESTSMDKVKVSRAAANLVERGLLRQIQNPKDRRGRLLGLTRKGTAFCAGIAPMAQEIDAAISTCLTRAEKIVLQKALSKLIEYTAGRLTGCATASATG